MARMVMRVRKPPRAGAAEIMAAAAAEKVVEPTPLDKAGQVAQLVLFGPATQDYSHQRERLTNNF